MNCRLWIPRDISGEMRGEVKNDILCCSSRLGSWGAGSSYRWAVLQRDSCAQEQLFCTAQHGEGNELQVT